MYVAQQSSSRRIKIYVVEMNIYKNNIEHVCGMTRV